MKKVILLDRDGVINHDSPHYIKSVDEFVFLPGSLEAIARLTSAGYLVGVATNQSGLARGYYGKQELDAIHEKMLHCVRAKGGEINAIEYCCHLPTDGCLCRKPEPGMLYKLADRFGCTLDSVPFVGDKASDVEAAKRAGATPVVVLSQMTDMNSVISDVGVVCYQTLLEFVEFLLGDRTIKDNT